MAIRIERTGARTVVAQRRRPVRLAAWGLIVMAAAAPAMALLQSREADETRARDHARVRCERSSGTCEVVRGGKSSVMRIDTMDAVAAETDGDGDRARVMAVVSRRYGLPAERLCEAGASDPEAAGIRAAVDQLARFVADRRVESVDVACDTRRPDAGRGSSATGRVLAQVGGTLLMWLFVVLFLVEIRTEIDGDAGVVRIRGRRALPLRRWSLERPIAEVVAVDLDTRRAMTVSFAIHLRFADGGKTLILNPQTGSQQKVAGWQADVEKALGLPRTPAGS